MKPPKFAIGSFVIEPRWKFKAQVTMTLGGFGERRYELVYFHPGGSKGFACVGESDLVKWSPLHMLAECAE